MNAIADRISEYLQTRGLFNPEMANHERVRDLLIDARTEIERLVRQQPARTFIAENFGVISQKPLKLEDWVNYETRAVGCAACGALMPHSPWPTNSTLFFHRPRCGQCKSSMTYPHTKPLTACAPPSI